MAEAVGEGLVVGTEAGSGDDATGRVVDGVAGKPRTSCGDGCSLGFMHDVEDLLLLVGCFAEDEGAGDVGLVAFDGAAIVDENDLILADDLRLERAVGEGRELTYLAGDYPLDAGAAVCSVDEAGELARGHAGLGGLEGGLVYGEGDVIGELHEGELGGGLYGAAAHGDRDGADCSKSGAGVGDAIREDELGTFFYADLAGGEASFFESLGEKSVGAFVFIPGVDLRGGCAGQSCRLGFHALADTAFFKDGADDEGSAGSGKYPGEEAFGLSPTKSGEVGEGGAGGDDEGAKFVLVKEGAGSFEALIAFGEGDGSGLGTAIRKSGYGGGQALGSDGRGGRALGFEIARQKKSGSSGYRGCGMEETST